jgi:outer membrane PBP1 activator LpoA protein
MGSGRDDQMLSDSVRHPAQSAPAPQQPVVMPVELPPLDYTNEELQREAEDNHPAWKLVGAHILCRERQLLDALRTIAQLRQQISDLERLPIAQLRSQVHELQCILEQKEARIAKDQVRMSIDQTKAQIFQREAQIARAASKK